MGIYTDHGELMRAHAQEKQCLPYTLQSAESVGGPPTTLPCLWSLGMTIKAVILARYRSLQFAKGFPGLHTVKNVLNNQTVSIQLNKIKCYFLVKFNYLQSTIF